MTELKSLLDRRRITLERWVEANRFTTMPEVLQYLEREEITISPETLKQVEQLLFVSSVEVELTPEVDETVFTPVVDTDTLKRPTSKSKQRKEPVEDTTQ